MATSTTTTTTAISTTTDPTVALTALLAALATVIAQAQADIVSTTTTSTQKSAARQVVAYATAAEQNYQSLLVLRSPRVYTVSAGDTLFAIAQAQLGDPRRYSDIQAASKITGLALFPGQQLLLPPN